jgi:addiction module HigA family antidote
MHIRSKLSTITVKNRTATSDLLHLVTPGEILVEEFLKPFRLTANALAIELRVPANRIQAIVNGQRGITADTALRLAQYFGNSAEFWLNLQQNYDLDQAKRDKLPLIQKTVVRRTPSRNRMFAAKA